MSKVDHDAIMEARCHRTKVRLIGELVRYRKKLGWSHEELAKKAKVTPAMIYGMEQLKAIPNLDWIFRIAMVMGLDLSLWNVQSHEDDYVEALLEEFSDWLPKYNEANGTRYDLSNYPAELLISFDRTVPVVPKSVKDLLGAGEGLNPMSIFTSNHE